MYGLPYSLLINGLGRSNITLNRKVHSCIYMNTFICVYMYVCVCYIYIWIHLYVCICVIMYGLLYSLFINGLGRSKKPLHRKI
jgi:ribosomal protein L20